MEVASAHDAVPGKPFPPAMGPLDREAVRPGVPMKVTRLSIIAALLAATITGCIVRTAPCHHECWWSHGHRICERRCD
jgi:hypothetical protein